MSRGLTEQLSPEESHGPKVEELEQAVEELYSLVGVLYAKLDTVEKVLGHAVDLPEQEALDRKRVNGL